MLILMSSVKVIEYKEYQPFVRPTDVPRLIADTKKFQSVANWVPKIKFEKILKDTLDYWREQISINPRL